MAESHKTAAALLNQFVFHFQKLGLDLKCPICLNWLNKPILLHCNHIFCASCATKSSQLTTQCPTCEQKFTNQEMKPSSYVEDIVTTYKRLDSAFNSIILPLLSADSGTATLVTTPINQLDEKYRKTIPSGKNNHADAFPANCVASQPESEKLLVNHVSEVSLGSLPACVDARDAECPTIDPVSRKRGTGNDTVEKSVGGTATDGMNEKDKSQIRKFKKPKKLNSGSSEKVLQSHGYRKQIVSHSDQAADKCKFKEGTSAISSTVHRNESACAFCHISGITERTGPLVHYAGGKEVARGDTDFPNAVTVHLTCVLWAPKVYFTEGVIRNLESELVRASRLKCYRCGLKGAALGCFSGSCRKSYHVPCAVTTKGCRWEHEGYLMLCPDHKQNKFPCEKSNPGQGRSVEKCSLPTQRNSASKWSNKEWVFCGSALSSKEKLVVDKFATVCGATVFDMWNPKVTHAIVATDSNGACKRTMEVLMAILHGRWILTTNWIKACQEANCPVNEELYEVNLDDRGSRNGPLTGRLRASNNAPMLFDGLKFYFIGEFIRKRDLLHLVIAGGGAIVESSEQIHDLQANSKTLIVYNRDLPQGCSSMEAACVVLNRLADAEDVARDSAGARVIPHTWILESVAAHDIVSYDLIS